MKTSIRTLIIAAVGMAAFSLTATRVQAAHPQVNEAIEQLEKARKADHPMEHLERAKHHLEESRHDKDGDREAAIHQVNEAMAAAKKNEHKRMEEHITLAIKEAREEKHDSPPVRRKKK